MFSSNEQIITDSLLFFEKMDNTSTVSTIIQKNYSMAIQEASEYTEIIKLVYEVIEPIEKLFKLDPQCQKALYNLFISLCDLAYLRSVQLKVLSSQD